ncbi:hypothetical protein [Ktedonobacter robiniae]|uniref:Uncharacterized protein n=1 Tax=Ktedonobacter robiniae TaxID=2778365 RepID=A0ABQ3UY72_9CHLR|nr:hypothetical protein [Ktedonobacter robiniae]GHO57829.1 hypothetical protein KSB_63040 [Ktedonobacter robiniae]
MRQMVNYWPQVVFSVCVAAYVLITVSLFMQGNEWARMLVFSAPVIVQAANYAGGAIVVAGISPRRIYGYWPWSKLASLSIRQNWRTRAGLMMGWPIPLAVAASGIGLWCANAYRAWVPGAGAAGYETAQNLVQAVLGGVASFAEVWHAHPPHKGANAPTHEGSADGRVGKATLQMKLRKRVIYSVAILSGLLLLSVTVALLARGVARWFALSWILSVGPILIMVGSYSLSAILGSAVPERRTTGKWPWVSMQSPAVTNTWSDKVYKMLLVEVLTSLSGSAVGSLVAKLATSPEDSLAVLSMAQSAIFTAGFLSTQWISSRRSD